MEIIQSLVAFFKANWVEVLAVIGAVDVILGVVSKWTPFKWDDNLYALLHKYIEKIAKKS